MNDPLNLSLVNLHPVVTQEVLNQINLGASEFEEISESNEDGVEEEGADDPLLEAIERLAAIPALEYDRIRKTESKRLGVRVATLDHEVDTARKAVGPVQPEAGQVEPWPQAVVLAEVLDEVVATVHRFVICEATTARAAALWIAFTWVSDFVDIAPIALITAPQMQCGKSTLLKTIGKLSHRPLVTSNISPSSVFRIIDAASPTLLIDEVDSFFRGNEELRGIINSGHDREGAFVMRTEVGERMPRRFSTWCPKVLSGIGRLPGTIMDRSIVLALRRKMPSESVERIRFADLSALCQKLARFAVDGGESIQESRPSPPEGLSARAQDNWEPLLAIADLAGGHWPQTARTTAEHISGGSEDDAETELSIILLGDIRMVFNGLPFMLIGGREVKRIRTDDLLRKLASLDTRPWATMNRGLQMTPKHLADFLTPYGIRARDDKWPGPEVRKGFRLDQFQDAFSRYLSPVGGQEVDTRDMCEEAPLVSRYPATCEHSCGSSGHETVAVADDVPQLPEHEIGEEADESATSDLSSTSEPVPMLACSGVAAENGSNEVNDPAILVTEPACGTLGILDPAPRRRGRPKKVT